MLIRRLALLFVVLVVVMCAAAGWLTLRQRDAVFIAPSAFDVQVEGSRVGERVISYRMAQPDVGWASTVARRLSLSGWSISNDRYAWGDTERYVPRYSRVVYYWFVRVRENAELRGDRDAAQITVVMRVDFGK